MAISIHSLPELLRWFARTTKRVVVLMLGLAVVGAGVAMLALPGPGVIVIVIGLAILATEFAWAERALDRSTARAATAAHRVSSRRGGRFVLALFGLSMVIGGALVVALVSDYRVIGVSVVIAGLIGMATLLPFAQRWIDSRATSPTSDHDQLTPNGVQQ